MRAWFLKIVRNRCVDLLRQRRRHTTETIELAAVPDSSRPELELERQETRAVLKKQLLALPHEQREIILLRDYHDLSYDEIANVLSIPAGTVMSRLHRARTELRRRMQRYG